MICEGFLLIIIRLRHATFLAWDTSVYSVLSRINLVDEKPLRILQIISSTATSGAEHHTIVLTRELILRGHNVEVICPPIPWMEAAFLSTGATVHAVSLKDAAGYPAFKYTVKLLNSRKFDIIHTHLSRAAYLGFLAGSYCRIPVISTVHVETKEPLYKFMPRGNNRLVAPSNFIRGLLRGRGVAEKYIDVVYNGTDFGMSDLVDFNSEVFEEFQIPESRKLIGLVGRVAEEKGQGLAVNAMPEVLKQQPNAHLLFVGRTEGDFHNFLQGQIRSMGLESRVTFTGNREDVARMFDAMTFSILPSSMESFGLAVIESMARARPVVVSRVGALSEIVVHDETGLVVDKTPGAFANAMSYLLDHPAECQRMGLNGRKMVFEKFTAAQMVERMEAVYRTASRA